MTSEHASPTAHVTASAAAPWLDRLQALAHAPSRPASRKPSSSLMLALLRLDLPAVIGFVAPLLDDPDRMARALAPIRVPAALKRSGQGYDHTRLGDWLTPLGAALHPMDAPHAPFHQASPAVREQQRTEQTALLGLLLALNAPVLDQDWVWSVEASRPPVVEPPPSEWLSMMLAHGAPVPTGVQPGLETLLEHAARFPTHWPDTSLQALIDGGIPLDHQVYHGPAVLRAVNQRSVTPSPGQRGLLPLLLEAGADLSVTSAFDGRAAVHQAVMLDDEARTLRRLVAHGADPQHVWVDDSEDAKNDPSCRSSNHGLTPLHVAVMTEHPGSIAVVNALLDLGVPVDLPDAEHGHTPLHVALLHRQEALAIHLVRNGASLDALNHQGQRPADMLDVDPRPSSIATTNQELLAEENEEERHQQITERLRQHLPLLEQQALRRVMDDPSFGATASPRPRARL